MLKNKNLQRVVWDRKEEPVKNGEIKWEEKCNDVK